MSLRERKKIKTRKTIRYEAYRLFGEQGYEATTVEQICAAAEVSPSTFFRYFPAKEDLVLSDEYDPIFADALRARPAGEPLVESLRHVISDVIGDYFTTEPEELQQRLKVFRDVPALRNRIWLEAEALVEGESWFMQILTERTGLPAGDLKLRVVSRVLLGAAIEAMLYWIEGNGSEDVVELVNGALDLLVNGLDV